MSLTSRIQALTAYANEVTGASDTTLSDAVATLAEGYGGGGDEVLFGTYGQLYIKDIRFSDDVTSFGGVFQYCKYLETFDSNNATSYTGSNLGYDENLKSASFPKITQYNSNYLIRQQGVQYNKLETIILGSVGYPVASISTRNWRYGSHSANLDIIIYVNYTSIADIPTEITTNAPGNSVYAPSGAEVNVIYKSSVTGEVLS